MAARKKTWRGRKVYARWLRRRELNGWTWVELARRSGIPLSTLQRWRSRVEREEAGVEFVEVVPAATLSIRANVEIVLRNERRLIVPIGSSVEGVRDLVTLLESC